MQSQHSLLLSLCLCITTTIMAMDMQTTAEPLRSDLDATLCSSHEELTCLLEQEESNARTTIAEEMRYFKRLYCPVCHRQYSKTNQPTLLYCGQHSVCQNCKHTRTAPRPFSAGQGRGCEQCNARMKKDMEEWKQLTATLWHNSTK